MIHDVLSISANHIWSQISIILFVLCFIGVVVWTIRGRKNRFDHESSIPLEDSILPESESEQLP